MQQIQASFMPKKIDHDQRLCFSFFSLGINDNFKLKKNEDKMGSLTAIYIFVFLVCVGIVAFIMALEKIRKNDEEDL